MTEAKHTPGPWIEGLDAFPAEDAPKPCPFCGGEPEYNNDTGPGDEGFWEWIECTGCGAKTGVSVWNRRSPDPALVKALEEAREALKPFSDFATLSGFNGIPGDAPMTRGSRLAARQVTAGDFRRARIALANSDAILSKGR